VAFQRAGTGDHDAIDAAYRTKYARYASTYVEAMLTPDAIAATLRLVSR
jgi:hypothetical protein